MRMNDNTQVMGWGVPAYLTFGVWQRGLDAGVQTKLMSSFPFDSLAFKHDLENTGPLLRQLSLHQEPHQLVPAIAL